MTYTGTLTNCQQLNAVQNKLQGLPLKGVHFGGGVHVAMPDTWDGTGAIPPGWTAYGQGSMVQTAPTTYVAELDARTQDSTVVATLSTADKTTLTTVLAAGTVQVTPIVDAEVMVG